MDVLFIAGQVMGVIAFALTVISLQCKKKSGILAWQIASNVSYSVQYLLLGALTGSISFIIGTFRNITFYICDKKGIKPKVILLVLFIVLIILCGIFTYKDITSILPIIGLIAWTCLVWQDNPKYMRIGEAFICIIWIVYNLFVRAYTGIITEAILLTSSLIGVWRFDIKKSQVSENSNLTNEIEESIEEDKESNE